MRLNHESTFSKFTTQGVPKKMANQATLAQPGIRHFFCDPLYRYHFALRILTQMEEVFEKQGSSFLLAAHSLNTQNFRQSLSLLTSQVVASTKYLLPVSRCTQFANSAPSRKMPSPKSTIPIKRHASRIAYTPCTAQKCMYLSKTKQGRPSIHLQPTIHFRNQPDRPQETQRKPRPKSRPRQLGSHPSARRQQLSNHASHALPQDRSTSGRRMAHALHRHVDEMVERM
ncbi:hypothetical protein IWZ01DRAFT_370757 [Phyllosticta capitalensis]